MTNQYSDALSLILTRKYLKHVYIYLQAIRTTSIKAQVHYIYGQVYKFIDSTETNGLTI